MEMMGNLHLHLGFLLGFLSLYLQETAIATDAPLGMTNSPAIPTSQNPTSQSQETTKPTTALTTTVSQEETSAARTSTFQSSLPTKIPTSPPLPSTLPSEALTSFYATTTTKTNQGPVTVGKDQATVNEAEICEENSKRLMLICFIIIGVLVFICVLLLLVIVVLASKMSNLKRRQPSKRLPRNNGDFLNRNSLWPVSLETLQRMSNETTGTDSKTQGLGQERTSAGPEHFEEAGKKLAREISSRQKNREMPAKSHDSPIARVEI